MECRRRANVMRRRGGLFLQLLLFLACGATGERTLVWEDEFDGDSLNGSVWAVNTGNGCDQGWVDWVLYRLQLSRRKGLV